MKNTCSGRFVWQGTIRADDLHNTSTRFTDFIREDARTMWGREGKRFQFCWSVGSAGGHVPVQFYCHSGDGGRSRKEKKHLAEQELHQHPLTERTRASDYLHSEISELFTHQNQQRSTRTIASSPFYDPVCTLSCGDMNLHATLLNHNEADNKLCKSSILWFNFSLTKQIFSISFALKSHFNPPNKKSRRILITSNNVCSRENGLIRSCSYK